LRQRGSQLIQQPDRQGAFIPNEHLWKQRLEVGIVTDERHMSDLGAQLVPRHRLNDLPLSAPVFARQPLDVSTAFTEEKRNRRLIQVDDDWIVAAVLEAPSCPLPAEHRLKLTGLRG
jgi:hypothetical protein